MNDSHTNQPNETRPPVLLEPAGGETENQSFGVTNPNLDETADVGKPDFGDLQLGEEVIEKFVSMIFPFGSSKLHLQTFDDFIYSDGIKRRDCGCVSKVSGELSDLTQQLQVLNRKGAGIFLDPNHSEIRVIFVDDNTIRDKPRDDWPIPPSIITETSKGKFNYLWLLNYTTSMATETFLGINRRLVRDHGHNRFSMGVITPIRVPGTFNCKSNEAFPCEIVGGTGKMVSESEMVKAFPPLPAHHGNLFDLQNGELNLPTEEYALIETVQEALAILPFPTPNEDNRIGFNMPKEECAIYSQWLDIGAALKCEFGENGFTLWDNSSAGCCSSSSRVTDNWYDAPDQGKGNLTIETVFHLAFEHGMGRTSSKPNRILENMVHWDEIKQNRKNKWLVYPLFREGGLSSIIGTHSVGKSFWALDICGALARGIPWRGTHHTEKIWVLYIAIEGGEEFGERVEAFKQEHCSKGEEVLFDFADLHLNLRSSKTDVSQLIDAILAKKNKYGSESGFVVIDTLAYAMSGGNEDSSVDMNILVTHAKQIQRQTNSHICLIHHLGKDASRGSRGSSVLPRAVDTEFTLTKNKQGITTPTLTKQRGGEGGLKFPFQLGTVQLGKDDAGNPMTSCVVDHLDMAEKDNATAELNGKKLETMLSICETFSRMAIPRPSRLNTTPGNEMVVLDEHLSDAFLHDGISSASKEGSRKRAYVRIRDQLIDEGYIGSEDKCIWIIDPHYRSIAAPKS